MPPSSPSPVLTELGAPGDSTKSLRGDGSWQADGGGGGAPAYLGVGDSTYGLYALDEELAAGDVIDGADLYVGDPSIGPYAMYVSIFPAPVFPPVVGTTQPGTTWRAKFPVPSSTQLGGGFAVPAEFIRIT